MEFRKYFIFNLLLGLESQMAYHPSRSLIKAGGGAGSDLFVKTEASISENTVRVQDGLVHHC